MRVFSWRKSRTVNCPKCSPKRMMLSESITVGSKPLYTATTDAPGGNRSSATASNSACVNRSYTGASGGMCSRIVANSPSVDAFQRLRRVARQQAPGAPARLSQPGPIGRPLHQKEHRVGFVNRGQAIGQLAKRLQLIGKFTRKRH